MQDMTIKRLVHQYFLIREDMRRDWIPKNEDICITIVNCRFTTILPRRRLLFGPTICIFKGANGCWNGPVLWSIYRRRLLESNGNWNS